MTFIKPLRDMTLAELDAELGRVWREIDRYTALPRDAQIAQRSEYHRVADQRSAINEELRRPERIRERCRGRRDAHDDEVPDNDR